MAKKSGESLHHLKKNKTCNVKNCGILPAMSTERTIKLFSKISVVDFLAVSFYFPEISGDSATCLLFNSSVGANMQGFIFQ